MKLKEFVKSALTDVVEAVAEAQESAGASGAVINPGSDRENPREGQLMASAVHVLSSQVFYPVMPVEFDVAVTVTEGETVEGSGGISVLGIGTIGGGASTSGESTSFSRIKFKVPMAFRPSPSRLEMPDEN